MMASARWRSIRRGVDFETRDALEDELLGPLRQAAQSASVPASAALRRSSIVLIAELVVDLADGLGTEARDPQQLDQAGRDLGEQLVVVGHPAGRGQLGDLVADRGADARDLRGLAVAVGGDQVDGAAPDRVRRPVVGHGLERQLALDLEHVADVVEDPREVAVGQLAVGLVLVVRAKVGVGEVDVGVVDGGGLAIRRRLDRGRALRRRIGSGDAARHGRDGTRGESRWSRACLVSALGTLHRRTCTITPTSRSYGRFGAPQSGVHLGCVSGADYESLGSIGLGHTCYAATTRSRPPRFAR